MFNRSKYQFDDFTEKSYCECLDLVKKNYKTILFTNFKEEGRVCLWRHDVDYSPHRSLKLAQLDRSYAITSTFFIWLHSDIYHFYEKKVFLIFKEIIKLGHQIGLHFDPDFYGERISTEQDLLRHLTFEKKVLDDVLEINTRVFSLHNPSLLSISLNEEEYCGMVNVYNSTIKRDYMYLSDSFCYWRYDRLKDVLESGEHQKLHILTHPECWTPEPMAPYKRILRAFKGRYLNEIRQYEKILAKSKIKKIK